MTDLFTTKEQWHQFQVRKPIQQLPTQHTNFESACAHLETERTRLANRNFGPQCIKNGINYYPEQPFWIALVCYDIPHSRKSGHSMAQCPHCLGWYWQTKEEHNKLEEQKRHKTYLRQLTSFDPTI